MSEHEQTGTAHSATARAVNSQHPLTDVGVWELDLRSNRLTWSEAVYRIFQVDPAQFDATYESFIERVHPEDRQRVDTAYLEHLTTHKPYSIAHRLLLPGNRVRQVYEHCHTEFDTAGKPLRSVGTVIDITNHQQQTQQILQLQKLSAIGHLSCGLLHDMNNFLTAIQSYGDLALNQNLDNKTRRYLEKMQQAGDRAANLIHQLLVFSRQESTEKNTVHLEQLLSDFMPLLQRLLPEHIAIDLEITENTPTVKAVPSQIEQVLMNLVINARDAIAYCTQHYGGSIRILLDTIDLAEGTAESMGLQPGRYARIAISDTGHGITLEQSRQILAPFYTTRAEGTGLGLAITCDILKAHRGGLEITSTADQGSCFSVYLPTETSSAEHIAIPSAPECLQGGNETILIVEDESMTLDVMAAMLTSLGYRTLLATSPQEARNIFANADPQPDLLLTDVALPEMSGRELGLLLRTQRPGLKILYMSGYPLIMANICCEDQATAFIAKPLRLAAVASAVRQLLDART